MTIKNFTLKFWQIICMCFSFILATQSTLARGADSLATKTVQFAIGSMVPMAGGVISESFTTLRSGVSLLKTTAGIGGIIIILLIMLPGITPLFLYRVGLVVVSEGAKILSLNPISSMIDEMSGIVELLLGITLYTSLMFVFSVIIFAGVSIG